MPNWRVSLTGDSWHLKALAALDVGVTEEGGAFVLRHPELDVLTDARAVHARAVELVDPLNGLGWCADSDFKPVEVGAVIGDDGNHTILIFAAEMLTVGQRAEVQVTDLATGQPIPSPPPPTFYAKAMASALPDEAVRRALHFVVPPVTAGKLWKAFEVIRDEVSEDEIVKRQWAMRNEIRRFRHTVNSPDALGDDARHGVEPSPQPPRNPMSLTECQEFGKRLLTRWLESK